VQAPGEVSLILVQCSGFVNQHNQVWLYPLYLPYATPPFCDLIMRAFWRYIPTFCLLAGWSALSAQVVFQKKIDSLYAAYGLATFPDGGYMVGGLQANCALLTRFNSLAEPLWTKTICPIQANDDTNIGYLHIQADPATSGFFVQFLKGGFSSAPDNLLNLMKFDQDGNLLWETQLRPSLRYGPFASGSQMALTPGGKVWSVHGLGYTPGLPYYNQVLLFKTSALGKVELRNYYHTNTPATANGIITPTDQDIYLYGGLGYSLGDGFLAKIAPGGAVQWARRYTDLSFDRSGGQFQNSDLLLYGVTPQGIAFARVRLDGSLMWVKKIGGGFSSNLYKVAADDGIFATLAMQNSDSPTAFLKLLPNALAAQWANAYETCTDYLTLETRAMPDGGLLCIQSANNGPRYTRFFKVNQLGELLPGCPVVAMSPPPLEEVSITVSDLAFSVQATESKEGEHLFFAAPATASIHDHCPAELPVAHFTLPDSICAPGPLQLAADGNNQASDWQWLMPGAMPADGHGAVASDITFPEAGFFTITLLQRYGICTDTFSDTLRVLPPLNSNLFDFDDTLICRSTPMYAKPLTLDFDAWLWEDGSTQPNRLLDPARRGAYRLQAQRGLCTVTDSFAVQISSCGVSGLFVPNVFSPNDDSVNDIWEISVQPDIALLGCAVYDRWGNLLYAAAEGEMPRWDGYYNGKIVPPGVYVWVLNVREGDEKERVERGSVTLIR